MYSTSLLDAKQECDNILKFVGELGDKNEVIAAATDTLKVKVSTVLEPAMASCTDLTPVELDELLLNLSTIFITLEKAISDICCTSNYYSNRSNTRSDIKNISAKLNVFISSSSDLYRFCTSSGVSPIVYKRFNELVRDSKYLTFVYDEYDIGDINDMRRIVYQWMLKN